MTERRLATAACVAAALAGFALLIANALAVRAGRPLFDVVPVT